MSVSPPYNPAVTSARIAERVSRATIFFPTAAYDCVSMTLSHMDKLFTHLDWHFK